MDGESLGMATMKTISDFNHLPKSKDEAKKIGSRLYFNGEKCPHGHIAPRITSRSYCVECSKVVIRKWQESNKDKVREFGRNRYHRLKDTGIFRIKIKKFHEKNPNYRKEYASKHRDNFSTYYKTYYRKHPEKMAIKDKIQSMRKRSAGGSFTEDDIKYILKLQKNKCAYCRKKLNNSYDLDHIIALSCGGTHHRSNLQITCPRCNRSKGKKHPIEFAQSIGLLI